MTRLSAPLIVGIYAISRDDRTLCAMIAQIQRPSGHTMGKTPYICA